MMHTSGPLFQGVEVDVADLPRAGLPVRVHAQAAGWGPRYVRFKEAADRQVAWAWRVQGQAREAVIVRPWGKPSEVIRAIRGLMGASDREIKHFYWQYGPLGYPQWPRLRGEPLEWVRWQARKLDAFVRLEQAFRHNHPEAIRALLAEGEPVDDTIQLPDTTPGGIEVPCPGGQPPGATAALMRAARLGITSTLREALAGVHLVPGDDWRTWQNKQDGTLRVKGTLAWQVPTLLQAVYLLYFLGAIADQVVRFCVICGTPYLHLRRRESGPDTCRPQCSDALRHRKFRRRQKRKPKTIR